jgi:ParB family chromosome partitioning protein
MILALYGRSMQSNAKEPRLPVEARHHCRLCHVRAPEGMQLCGGCAERLELEIDRDPRCACTRCGRHQELCSIWPCVSEPAARGRANDWKLRRLPLAKIVPTPAAQNSRRRYDQSSLDELARSVREHGMLQPLCVRPRGDHFVLIFGLRRFHAAVAAGLREVPCTVLPADDDQALLLNITENLQREQLRGSERLHAIEQLAATGLGVRELSRKTGFAPSTISRWLRVDRTPALRAAVESGKLDIGQAKILVDAPKSALPTLLEEAPRLTTAGLRERVLTRKRIREIRSVPEMEDRQRLEAAIAALRAIREHVADSQLLVDLHAEVDRVSKL